MVTQALLWNSNTGALLHVLTDKASPSKPLNQSEDSWRGLISLIQGPAGGILCIAFSPVGHILASGDRNRAIRLWDVRTGKQIRELTGPVASEESIYYVGFSSDGKQLISAATDDTIVEWDVANGTQTRSMRGQLGDNKRTSLRPDGSVLALGGENGRIVFLNANGNQLLYYLIPIDDRDSLVVTPDGLFDGTATAWKQILWRSAEQTTDFLPIEAFFNEFYHPDLVADLMSGRHPVAPRKMGDLDRRQPQIRLTPDPENSSDLRNVTVSLQVLEAPPDEKHKVKGSGARDVRLFRNGSLVKVWRGDVLKGQSSVTLQATIPLVAGENELTAYAFNDDNIKSSDANLSINGSDTLRRARVAYILSIGINEYANSQYNLKYAVADAQDFGQELKREQTKLRNYESVEVIALHDRDATKANILRSLTDLTAKIQPEDALVIFFAGHGTTLENRFYLIPHDLGYTGSRTQLDSANLRMILAHSISDDELENAIENIDAETLLLVIDACNSGQALEAEEKRRGPMNSKGLAQLAYEKGMYILTAAQSFQAAHEAERFGHGFLTYALVEEGLKTKAADREPNDGQVLLREWLNYATERVPKLQQSELEKRLKENRQLERLKVSETDEGKDRVTQHPKVFYRRETELRPLIVAKH